MPLCAAFDWTVEMVNAFISRPAKAAFCVGVLDIFGFENFSVNSFPQVHAIQLHVIQLTESLSAIVFATRLTFTPAAPILGRSSYPPILGRLLISSHSAQMGIN